MMSQKKFNPDLASPQTLAGVNIEMKGKTDLAVRPAKIVRPGAGSSIGAQPNEDRLADINVSMGDKSGKRDKAR